MEQPNYTELEMVLQRTIEKQSKRIATLTLDLDLAYSQIELLKEKENEDKSEG